MSYERRIIIFIAIMISTFLVLLSIYISKTKDSVKNFKTEDVIEEFKFK